MEDRWERGKVADAEMTEGRKIQTGLKERSRGGGVRTLRSWAEEASVDSVVSRGRLVVELLSAEKPRA